jgi:tetratricopeptide (TPR) repeat protein
VSTLSGDPRRDAAPRGVRDAARGAALGALLGLLTPALAAAANEYQIDLSLDPARGTLHGVERVVYKNDTEAPLNVLTIEAPGLPGTPPGNERWHVASAVDSKGKNLTLVWKPEEQAYTAAIAPPLGAGFKTTLTIDYERPVAAIESAAGYLNLHDRDGGAWYLKLRAYRAGSFGSDDFKDMTVNVAVPAGWILAATGTSPPKAAAGRVTLVAKKVRNFGLALSDKFKSAKGAAGPVPITVYSLDGQDAWARNALAETIEAVGFTSAFLGAFPPPQVSVLPAGPGEEMGSSSTHLIYAPVTENADLLREAIALQAARLVWGWSIGDPSDAVPFVANGVAAWCQQNYLAKKNGIDLHAQFLRSGVNDTFLAGVLRGYDTTLMRSRAERAALDWDFERIVARAKSAAVIHMLGGILGEDKLQEVLRGILKTNKQLILTDRDFQGFAQAASAARLDGFFEQWLRTKNTLDYYLSHVRTVKTDAGFEVHADVYKTGTGAMPVEILAEDVTGARVRSVFPADRSSGELVVPLKAPFASILLDPRHYLPLISRVGPRARLDLAEGLIAESKLLRADEQLDQAMSDAPQDPRALFLRGRVLKERGDWKAALALWAKTISASPSPSDPSRIWAQLWTARLADLQGKRSEATALYNAVAALPDVRGSRAAAAAGLEKPYEDAWPPRLP